MDHTFWQIKREKVPPVRDLSQVINYGYHVANGWEVSRPPMKELGALLSICLTGNPNFRHGEEWFEASRGSVTLYLAEEYQWYRCENSWEGYWFHFWPSKDVLEILKAYGIRRGEVFKNVLNEDDLLQLAEMFAYSKLREPQAFHRAAVMCERIIYRCLKDDPKSLVKPRNIRLRDIGPFICLNPALDHSVKSLARKANLSPSRFAHLFKTEYGISVRKYVTKTRMDEAKRLLVNTCLSASEVGYRVGYQSPYYFYTAFKKASGMTTLDYRQTVKPNESLAGGMTIVKSTEK